MKRTFFLIERSNKKIRMIFMIFFIISFLGIMIPIFLIEKFPRFGRILQIIFTITFIATGIVHLIRSFVIQDFIKIGTITFSDFEVSININDDQKNFYLKDTNDLIIIYGGYAGKMHGTNRSFYSHDGSNNKIRFKIKEQKYEYRYLVPDKYGEIWLHKYADYLLKNGLEFIFNNSDNMFRTKWNLKSPAANSR